MSAVRVSIVLPTWNGERDLARLLPALAAQELPGGFEIRAVDSGSTDRSCELLEKAGARLRRIPHAEFRHGSTRNLAAKEAEGEILVFLSQDALPRDTGFLAALASAFDDPEVAGAHARILPHEDDDPLTARTVLSSSEAGEAGETRGMPGGKQLADLDPAERARLCAFNDVASAIRASVFLGIPFPDVAFGEDVAWAARALEAGWKIRFEPRAVVLHAHRYSLARAYARYRTDAAFQREALGRRIRPSLWSVARGIGYEVREDARFAARHGGALHLLRSPFLRAAQVLGQYAGEPDERLTPHFLRVVSSGWSGIDMVSYGRLKDHNSALVRDDLNRHNEVWRGLPEIVNLNHTDICNLRCIMCTESVKPGKMRMSVPRLQELLKQVLPTARKLKLTTAGEPLLFDFEEIVELAREYQVLLSLITNGTHLTIDRYLKMKDVLHHLTISLDSHDRDVFTKIRGKGAYDKIMTNLRELRKFTGNYEFNFHVQMVLMRSNLETLPGFVSFAKELGVHVVNVTRLHFPFEGLQETEDIFGDFPAETRDKYVHAAMEEARRLGVNLALGDLGYPSVLASASPDLLPHRPPTYICGWVAQEIYIDPAEQVYPCCIADASLIMGDLKTHTFAEVWNGPKYRKLRRRMFEQKLSGYCSDCKLYAPIPDDAAFDLRNVYRSQFGARGGVLKRVSGMLRKALKQA